MLAAFAAAALFACAAAQFPPLGPLRGIYSLVDFNLGLRHCQCKSAPCRARAPAAAAAVLTPPPPWRADVASVCPLERGNEDFLWTLVAPLQAGAPAGAFSLSPLAFPTYYLTLLNSTTGAVGPAESPVPADATWLLAPPRLASNASNAFTLVSQSASPAWAGKLLTASTARNAPCAFPAPAGDALLTDGAAAGAARVTFIVGDLPPAPPQPAAALTVDVATVTNPAVNRRIKACHHDYGFAQAPRGFTANLIYGSSFEAGTQAVPAWTPYSRNCSDAAPALTDFAAFSGKPSMSVSLSDGGGENGLRNRGLGGAGFALQGGSPYTVELFVWSGGTPIVFVELADYTTNETLARQEFTVQSTGPDWGSTWVRVNMTLTPSRGTSCAGISFGSDPAIDCGNTRGDAQICVRCGGELRLGLASAGNVKLGFVSLMPGAWGLVAGKDGAPIPVLKSGGDLLTAMGITLMRNGGSVSQSMRWKDWRGPVWSRPSQQQIWGKSLLSGWGPFEYAELGEALDIEPVITLAYDTNDALDFGDLIEYCWGDAATTSWGARRAADRGHSRPYNISTWELGK